MPKLSSVLLSVIAFGGASVFLLLAMIFNVTSLASNNWLYFGGIQDSSQGLWKACTKSGCESLSALGIPVPNWLQAVRAFLILPLLLVMVAVPLSVISVVLKKGVLLIAAAICTAAQGVFTAISVIIFTVEIYKRSEQHFSWSFVLGWLTMVFYVFSCVVFITAAVALGKSKQSQYHTIQ